MKQDKITIYIRWKTETRSRADIHVTDGLLPEHVVDHLEKALAWAKQYPPDSWEHPMGSQLNSIDNPPTFYDGPWTHPRFKLYPCHRLAREQWCDRDGPGGFMGHTCK